MFAALLLAGALVLLWLFVRRDRGEYRAFKLLGDTSSRQARYRVWIAKAALFLLLPSLVALALLGRLDALAILPPEFASFAGTIGPIEPDRDVLFGAGIGGAIAGALIGAWLTARRGKDRRKPVMLGDVGALLPRNRGELAHAAALAISAGVTEEPFFRLLLPLLITLVTGSAILAFLLAALLFGLAHRYQGWPGMLATGVMALLFTALYLATGSLLIAIAFHAMIDVAGLVIRPALAGVWRNG